MTKNNEGGGGNFGVLAIDPGLKGGLVYLWVEEFAVIDASFLDMPIDKESHFVDDEKIVTWLNNCHGITSNPQIGIMEELLTFGMGRKSLKTAGINWGICYTILSNFTNMYTILSPVRWRKYLNIPTLKREKGESLASHKKKIKDFNIRFAKDTLKETLFYTDAEVNKMIKNDGRADAFCMACVGIGTYLGKIQLKD